MSFSKPRLMLDADGVLVDFITPVLDFFKSVGKQKFYHEITQWDIFEGDTELEDSFKENFASKPGYCYNLKPLPGAIDFIRAAREKYSLAIVTSPYNVPYWYNERKDWIVDMLGIPQSAITFTSHKQYVDGDVFVEDNVENISKWNKYWNKKQITHLPVVMDQPWNRVSLPKEIVRVSNFQQLSKSLEEFGLPCVF